MDILLIISGSIAAYKSLEVIREFRRRKHNLRCVLSACGEKFVTPLSITSLSGTHTYTERDFFALNDAMQHVSLSRSSDVILVAPASADLIAKAAHGICDTLATTVLVAANIPIVIAPAMNTAMWESRVVQRNLAILRRDGFKIINPQVGVLACGEEGYGKVADPLTIVSFVESLDKSLY